MSRENEGAFPYPVEVRSNQFNTMQVLMCHQGMTIREKFAESALMGMLANPGWNNATTSTLVDSAICAADTLILALKKPSQ